MSKSIIFSTQTVDLITCELIDMHLSHKDGMLSRVALDVSVDYNTFLAIKKNGYFHMTFDVIPAKIDFDAEKDIIMTLKADPMLVRTLAEMQDDEVVNRALIGDGEFSETVRKEINWYALKVVQEVSLPDDLEEKGTVLEGFETAHAIEEDENEYDDITEDLSNYIDEFKDIEYILKKYNIPYVRHENDFSGQVTYKDHTWAFFIYETNRVFVMCSAYTFFVSENKLDTVCRELARINSELTVGSFDLDLEEGVITFRTYLDIGDELLLPDLFERMLIGNIATTGKYYASIYELVD